MKKVLSVALAMWLCFVLLLSASAKSVGHEISGIKFRLDDGYELLTEKDLLVSSDVEGLVFAAISSDGENQIQARRTSTDFSKEIGSFKGLLPQDLEPVGQKLFPEGYTTAEFGSDVYLKQISETNGQYTAIYVTISDKSLFTFTYFGSDPTVLSEFMGGVTLPGGNSGSGSVSFIVIILYVCIAVLVVILVMLALSFVKDYRRRKMEQNENIVSNYIKIKRRKY